VGHNPIARIGVTCCFCFCSSNWRRALSSPEPNHWFAQWVAAPGVDPAIVQPGAVDVIDKASYQAMRALRDPIVEVHEVTFYSLALL
jgi:Ni/Fe-hydrogenase 1 B-type cytochrome subunit